MYYDTTTSSPVRAVRAQHNESMGLAGHMTTTATALPTWYMETLDYGEPGTQTTYRDYSGIQTFIGLQLFTRHNVSCQSDSTWFAASKRTNGKWTTGGSQLVLMIQGRSAKFCGTSHYSCPTFSIHGTEQFSAQRLLVQCAVASREY